MAAINDLISQIDNKELRDRILLELEKMNKQKKFGLVFEEHLPESVKMFDVPVKKGAFVMEKTGGKNVFKVLSIADGIAECIDTSTQETKTLPISDIVSVALFGTPIYPYLKPIDSICNAPDSDLWHTLIEADNYHALQLMEYMYAGKVDCIYIDPPYNTGARDWKYNNDYVDGADEYRHSKWLSFMQRRLALAKKLLNPKDSVLIVTIDEKEYLHLGCLMEQMFPEAQIQMISSVINRSGSVRKTGFSRCLEYIFFIMFGQAVPYECNVDLSGIASKNDVSTQEPVTWQYLRRRASNIGATRKGRPGLFYPVFIDRLTGTVHSVGEALPASLNRKDVLPPDGCWAAYPLKPNGEEGCWQVQPSRLREQLNEGTSFLSKANEEQEQVQILYLKSGDRNKILSGEIKVIGREKNGKLITEGIRKFRPKDVWMMEPHDATSGSNLLNTTIFHKKRFDFPKSLYAVTDSLRLFVSHKKNALVLDFFAGSGTTLHAVNLLNAEDGGHRRCIMVTNNEVSDEEAKNLRAKGYQPGDEEWEKLGIARYVTWPRTVCSIKGVDINGTPLKGNYISDKEIPMADGFKANAIFFKLGFLNHNSVKLGRQFFELLPVLWMKAGAIGPCPDLKSDNLPDWLILPENKFAVLIDDNQYHAFKQEVEKVNGIDTLYIITDFEREYTIMAEELGIRNTFQLYRDYLDNFRINHSR